MAKEKRSSEERFVWTKADQVVVIKHGEGPLLCSEGEPELEEPEKIKL